MTAAALAILIAHDHAVVRRELPNGSARRPAPSRQVGLLVLIREVHVVAALPRRPRTTTSRATSQLAGGRASC
jgi:hypothetical protein